MSLREYLDRLTQSGELLRIQAPVSTELEMAGVLKKLEPRPVLFENIAGNVADNVAGSGFRVVGNLFGSKAAFASYFGLSASDIIPLLLRAIDERSPYEVVETGPCQEVISLDPDLDAFPILRHCQGDGGRYISSGVFMARHPSYGQNADFHRCMQFSSKELAVRVVPNRHFDVFLKDLKQVDVAICVGNGANILAAAATSVALGIDELEIANALEPLKVVKAKTVDVYVPAEAEFILEGTVYFDRRHPEGPFVDLTETQDVVRQEPVFELRAITHRKDAIWQALLPGALEHKLLMGMPREPTIYKEVNRVAICKDVNISPGGCSWLHAVVQIDKRAEKDGIAAIHAAFAGHRSCKHVFVVDTDIDIYNPLDVEWAMATRFQADRGLVIKEKEQGSSLDPSAEPGTALTTKVGFDLTRPLETKGKLFGKVQFPDVDLHRYMKE